MLLIANGNTDNRKMQFVKHVTALFVPVFQNSILTTNNVSTVIFAPPPALGHFCSLHTLYALGSGRAGWLVSPAPNFLTVRQTELAWLGKLSSIRHIDESQLLTLAASF